MAYMLHRAAVFAEQMVVFTLGLPAALAGYSIGFAVGSCVRLEKKYRHMQASLSSSNTTTNNSNTALDARRSNSNSNGVHCSHCCPWCPQPLPPGHCGADCALCRPAACARCGAACTSSGCCARAAAGGTETTDVAGEEDEDDGDQGEGRETEAGLGLGLGLDGEVDPDGFYPGFSSVSNHGSSAAAAAAAAAASSSDDDDRSSKSTSWEADTETEGGVVHV